MKYIKPTTPKTKLTFIQAVLKTDFFFFQHDAKGMFVLLYLESSKSTPGNTIAFKFSGRNMMHAIEEALDYVLHEIEADTFELPKEYALKDEVTPTVVDSNKVLTKNTTK